MSSRLFGVGIGGTRLAPAEARILERHPPYAVILFRRNVESEDQLLALVSEIRRAAGRALLCVDQEGGTVDRFRDLLGSSISFRAAAQAGLAREAGDLAGEACALLGFDVDLVPVVDRMLPGASAEVLRDRCAAADPREVARAALDFLAGLHSRGVGGCVKHFPGLGRAALDTHKELPRLAADAEEERLDLDAFRRTMNEAGAVMISHAAGPDGVPSSLSPANATGLLRGRLGFLGAAFSDDLEMGALAAFGDLPQRCVAAARAGCDLLFVCSKIETYPDCVESVERSVPEERRREAAGRLAGYEAMLDEIRSRVRFTERPLEALAEDIRALRERAAGRGARPAGRGNGETG